MAKPSPSGWTRGRVTAVIVAGAIGMSAFFGEQPEVEPSPSTPLVEVYVQSGGQAVVWEGQPVAAGDLLRVGVRPLDYDWITVRSGVQTLYSAPLVVEDGESLVPEGWPVDAGGEVERLVVVLSVGPPEEGGPSWEHRVVLPKP